MARLDLRSIKYAALITCSLAIPFSGAQAETTVALVQLPSSDVGDFSKLKNYAEQAKVQGAQLVVFPEASVFGWPNPDVFTQAQPIPGRHSDQFASIALSVGIWVATGLAEKGPKAGSGSLSNAFQAYDAAVLINPQGEIVLHHRKFNVLANAFDPSACQAILNQPQCAYTPGSPSDISIAETPFGRTALLVCADAYTYPPATALAKLKSLSPDFVIVPWGITAGTQAECGTSGFNATGYAAEAAGYLKSAFVVGANAVGPRTYGKYLPSIYCGDSGYATPTGKGIEASQPTQSLVLMTVPDNFDADAGPIWNTADASGKCPITCSNYDSGWNGQWKTTTPGKMSVCGCATRSEP